MLKCDSSRGIWRCGNDKAVIRIKMAALFCGARYCSLRLGLDFIHVSFKQRAQIYDTLGIENPKKFSS